MQTIVRQLEAPFRAAIHAAFGFEADPMIAVAQNDKFGDYQANAAMGLAKQVAEKTGQKANPRAIAEQIKAKLDLGSMAQEVTIAGPGFINLRRADAAGASHIQDLEEFYRQANTRFKEDPAFADEARATVVRLQAGGAAELALWKRIGDESRRHYQPVYEQLGVQLTQADER